MFNSLKCAKRLEEAGFTREQAEVHVQVMVEMMEMNLVTRDDFHEMRAGMRELSGRVELLEGKIEGIQNDLGSKVDRAQLEVEAKFDRFQAEFENKLDHFRAEFENKLEQLRTDFEDKLEQLRTDFENKLEQLRSDFENKLLQSEYRMTIRLGTVVSVAIGVAVALAKIVS